MILLFNFGFLFQFAIAPILKNWVPISNRALLCPTPSQQQPKLPLFWTTEMNQ